jgi:hypothetical protein
LEKIGKTRKREVINLEQKKDWETQVVEFKKQREEQHDRL